MNVLYACCIFCFIFVLYEIFLACVVSVLYAGCKKNKTEKQNFFVLYFSARGTRSIILCALWYYCVAFSARGTRSGVIVLYFLRVQHALVFCVKFILCCNILTL